MVCVVFTLITGGLNGRAETQERDTTDGGPRLILQITTDTNEPFSGMWVLNLSKSKFPSQFLALTPKSQITHVAMNAADIEITQETTFESDEKLNMHLKAKFDGKDYPINGVPGAYSVAYNRVNKNTIKAVLKRDGKVVVQEIGDISTDGKSLTINGSITDATGNQKIIIAVFEKK
jgi:hypothetical protein